MKESLDRLKERISTQVYYESLVLCAQAIGFTDQQTEVFLVEGADFFRSELAKSKRNILLNRIAGATE